MANIALGFASCYICHEYHRVLYFSRDAQQKLYILYKWSGIALVFYAILGLLNVNYIGNFYLQYFIIQYPLKTIMCTSSFN